MYVHTLCLLYICTKHTYLYLNILVEPLYSGRFIIRNLSLINVHFFKNSDYSYVTCIVPDNHVLIKGVSLIQGSVFTRGCRLFLFVLYRMKI